MSVQKKLKLLKLPTTTYYHWKNGENDYLRKIALFIEKVPFPLLKVILDGDYIRDEGYFEKILEETKSSQLKKNRVMKDFLLKIKNEELEIFAK
jgi:hypothetical protein